MQQEKPGRKREKLKKARELWTRGKKLPAFLWAFQIVAVLFFAIVVALFFFQSVTMRENSMEPTLDTGDRIFVNRFSYQFSEPKRGDIIVFKTSASDDAALHIKRVIGLPGDTIAIEDGKIYINGSAEPLQEDYLKEEWTVATGPYTFEVPEESYFMMGDNRNDSWDARYWSNTYVTKDKILGKALFTYWPFAHFGKLE